MSVQSAVPAAGNTASGEVTVFGIFAALMRRKRWIMLPTLLAAIAAVGYVIVTPPEYIAEATIIVESQESPFTRPQADSGQQQIDTETVASQVQVIKSVDVANIVIDRLGLAERAEFNPDLRPAGLLDILTSLLGAGKGEDDVRKAVLREYFDHMTAYAVSDTRVIVVQFWSRDDQLTADAANAIADAYLEVQREISAKMTSDATGWLEKQITDLRAKVSDAERNVELYRTENGLFTASGTARGEDNTGTTLQSQQLSELSTQLSQARAQRSDAQARARLIREKLEDGQAIETREVANSGLIQRLQEERVRLASQVAELASTFLPAHPRMQELRAQLSNLDRQIRNEVEKIVGGLENDAAVAAAREVQIEANIEALKSNVALANENEVQLRALEREAKAQRDLLASYLARYREAAARNDNELTPADARIISRATVPLEPYFPAKVGIPVMAAIAALVISTAIVMTVELASAYSMTPAARAEDVEPRGSEVEGRREPYLEPNAGGDGGSAFTGLADAEPSAPEAPDDDGEMPQDGDGHEDAGEGRASGPIAAAMRRAGRMMSRSEDEVGTGMDEAVVEPAAMPAPEAVEEPAAPAVHEPASAGPAPISGTMVVTAVGDPVVIFETALAHGRSLAGEGARVILVDTVTGAGLSADLLGQEPDFGYFDLICGEAVFADVMFRDPESRLHVIAPGVGDPELVDDEDAPRIVLEALGQTYDMVIVVAQPVYSATLAPIAGEVAIVRHDEGADDVANELARMLADVATGQVAVVAPETSDMVRASIAEAV